MTNSRNEMNECLLDLIYAALVRTVIVPERVVLEHMMLITILHANVGPEVGKKSRSNGIIKPVIFLSQIF